MALKICLVVCITILLLFIIVLLILAVGTKVLEMQEKLKDGEAKSVAHARWKEYTDISGTVYPECSRCGLVWWLDEGTAEENEMYYCPKCGAKMDEKRNS